jgi:hypothetical protein
MKVSSDGVLSVEWYGGSARVCEQTRVGDRSITEPCRHTGGEEVEVSAVGTVDTLVPVGQQRGSIG